LFSKVFQHSTRLINYDKFSIEHGTPHKAAENVTKGQIYNYTVAMISVMLRSLRRTCNAIFCYYYFKSYREGKKVN